MMLFYQIIPSIHSLIKKWNEDSGESFPNKMSLLIKMQMIK